MSYQSVGCVTHTGLPKFGLVRTEDVGQLRGGRIPRLIDGTSKATKSNNRTSYPADAAEVVGTVVAEKKCEDFRLDGVSNPKSKI